MSTHWKHRADVRRKGSRPDCDGKRKSAWHPGDLDPTGSDITPPALSILSVVRCERLDGESLFDAAHRLVITELMIETGGRQREAARRAGCSVRLIHETAKRLRLRPSDRGLRR